MRQRCPGRSQKERAQAEDQQVQLGSSHPPPPFPAHPLAEGRGSGSTRVYCTWAGLPWGWVGDGSSEHPLGRWFGTGPREGCWGLWGQGGSPVGPCLNLAARGSRACELGQRVAAAAGPLVAFHACAHVRACMHVCAGVFAHVCVHACACVHARVSERGRRHFSLSPAGRGSSSSISTSKNSTTAPSRSRQPIT